LDAEDLLTFALVTNYFVRDQFFRRNRHIYNPGHTGNQ
jgi:hypothetical protein